MDMRNHGQPAFGLCRMIRVVTLLWLNFGRSVIAVDGASDDSKDGYQQRPSPSRIRMKQSNMLMEDKQSHSNDENGDENGKSKDRSPKRKDIPPKICRQRRKTSCHGFLEHRNWWQQAKWRWSRRKRPSVTSYRMAVLANMAYWHFNSWDPYGDDDDDDALRNETISIHQGKRRMKEESVLGFSIGRIKFHQWLSVQSCRFQRVARIILSRSNPIVTVSTDPDPRWSQSCQRRARDRYLRHTMQRHEALDSQSNPKAASFTTFHYYFYNWREPTGIAGVNFHDTDVLVSSYGSSVVIAFAGTASTADAFTNIQTFEPAHHSAFFHGGKAPNATTRRERRRKQHRLRGSIHRGFLNAYSRVRRGSVLRVCGRGDPDCERQNRRGNSLTMPLDKRFGLCTGMSQRQQKKEKNGTLIRHDHNGCHSSRGGDKLATILREVAFRALNRGKTVHIVGHSLGGGTATMMALDVIVNFPEVPVSKLHLWTFGAPQVADNVFLESCVELAPRLGKFVVQEGELDKAKRHPRGSSQRLGRRGRAGHNGRFHRFVTLSDDCKVDVVTEVTKRALAAHKSNIRGTAARRLGGVQGHVTHFSEPHYLLTTHQYETDDHVDTNQCHNTTGQSRTKSTVAAHSMINYLDGISRESGHHLFPILPEKMADFVLKRKESGSDGISG